MDEIVEIIEQLHQHRIVETEAVPQGSHRFHCRRARLGGHGIRRVARCRLQQKEIENDDAEHGGDGLQAGPRQASANALQSCHFVPQLFR